MGPNSQDRRYDAFLLVSFGGPEGRDDVIPFLNNVLRGKNVPPERMHAVAEHYYHFGGVSPINQQNRQLIAALEPEIQDAGPKLRIYWGNRNWHPLLSDTVRQMAKDGVNRAIALATSAYSSYSSCRQYLEDIARAQAEVGPSAPTIDKIRPFYNHPEFIQANADNLAQALRTCGKENAQVVFTAHSIPETMAIDCAYQDQLLETSKLVVEAANHKGEWRLAYQSRSGSPTQPWLGPDILDLIREQSSKGSTNLVLQPIGFLSDHMEVMYDLDLAARELCESLGTNYLRAATVGTHPRFIKMIKDLVQEKIDQSNPKVAVSNAQDSCSVQCCPSGFAHRVS